MRPDDDVGARGKAPGLHSWGAAVPVLVCLLLVFSLLAWRNGVYYSGGFDGVVVAKAAVGCAALAMAWFSAPAGALDRLRPRTLVVTGSYLAVSMIGAMASGSLIPSGVLAVRVAIVLATVAFLVTSFSAAVLIRSLSTSMCAIGAVLAVSGASTYLSGGGPALTAGRLAPTLLTVSPNQLALLFGLPILVLMWRITQGRVAVWHIGLLMVLGGLTWLTGSRTGLLGLAMGVVFLLLLAPRVHVGAFITVLVGVPAVLFVATFTAVLSGYFGRGGTENLTTLNSRTVAWQAAFSADRDFFSHWFGGGLSIKTVTVEGAYWDAQVLDSTWVSTFVQAGVLGLLLLGLWSVSTLWWAGRDRTPYRRLWLALAAYAVLRSALETGLLDTYVLFVVMLVPALMVDLRPSDQEADQQGDAQSEQQPARDVGDKVPSQIQATH